MSADACTQGLDTGFIEFGRRQGRGPRRRSGHFGTSAYFFDGSHAYRSCPAWLARPWFGFFRRHAIGRPCRRRQLFLGGRERAAIWLDRRRETSRFPRLEFSFHKLDPARDTALGDFWNLAVEVAQRLRHSVEKPAGDRRRLYRHGRVAGLGRKILRAPPFARQRDAQGRHAGRNRSGGRPDTRRVALRLDSHGRHVSRSQT